MGDFESFRAALQVEMDQVSLAHRAVGLALVYRDAVGHNICRIDMLAPRIFTLEVDLSGEDLATEEEPEPDAKNDSPVTVGPWSVGEKRLALDLARQGRSNVEIARHLGRSAAGIGPALKSARAAEAARGPVSGPRPAPTAPVPQPLPEDPRPILDWSACPVSEPRPVPVAPAQPPLPEDTRPILDWDGGPVKTRAVGEEWDDAKWNAHLDKLGNDALWRPVVDLALVEALTRGAKAAHLAGEMGISVAQIADRFRALYPAKVPSLSGQQRLIAVLKDRISRAGV